jgi:hypothetical protein
MTVVALPRHRTGVRVDAQDIWMMPRPQTEKVPAAVREIDVRTSKAQEPLSGHLYRPISRLLGTRFG